MRRASCPGRMVHLRMRADVCGRLVSLCRCIRAYLRCICGRRVRESLRVLCATFRYMPCSSRFHSRAFAGCSWMGAVDASFPYPSGAAVDGGSALADAGECVGSWWSVLVVGGHWCSRCFRIASMTSRDVVISRRVASARSRVSNSEPMRTVIVGYLFTRPHSRDRLTIRSRRMG